MQDPGSSLRHRVEPRGTARPIHVLWLSDSPDTPSGFGNVTRFVCRGLARAGHRISVLGWQTLESHDWEGCRIHATRPGALGSDMLYAYLVRHRPDVVVALADPWWLPFVDAPHVRQQLELTRTPWVLYFPVDGETEDGLLPASWVELLRAVDVPVAMSRYGQEIAERSGLQCELIPHGVDLEIFAPPDDREEAKAELGLDGHFVVLSDSRNQPRKLLPRLLDVFERFVAERPDAVLHLHTDVDDEFASSPSYAYDVRADARHLGLESALRFTPGFEMRKGAGLSLDSLARYYRAADVHLLASSGEGFGLPTLQAAAAGAVPMAGAYSASRELVEGHGEAIRIDDWGESEFGVRRGFIDVDDAVRRLVRLYDDRDELRRRSAASRRFALGYGWDGIVATWDDVLRSAVERARAGARLPVEQEVEEVGGSASTGMSVTVRRIRREFGRLEMAIAEDARQLSDVRLPTVPRAWATDGLRVERRAGSVCVGPSEELLLLALRRIFPKLTGWHPGECGTPEEVRLELARSVLVLNSTGALPESALRDAALFGVPCVGTASVEVQRVLWPELAVDDPWEAVSLARAVLTDAARARRIAARAAETCRARYAPDESKAAQAIRRASKAADLARKGA
jgi:glycosyltransferase involved in cell wall biosynthesis